MKTWLTPTAVEDKFIPNEAVSTCYAVACDWSEANKYEDKFGLKGTSSFWQNGEWIGKVEHSENGCGTASSQKLTVKNGILTSIKEGNFNGHLYQDPEYNRPVNSLKVENGTMIYWTTTAKDPKRTWHHQGRVFHVDDKSMS